MLSDLVANIGPLIPIILIVYVLTDQGKRVGIKSVEKKKNWILFGLGGLFFFFAVFPYLAIGVEGLNISHWDWRGRSQLLVPLGASLLLFYGVQILLAHFGIQSGIRKVFQSLILASFIGLNINYYAEYQGDWFKQQSIIENLRSSEVVKQNTSFLFIDETEHENAHARKYRTMEYTGLLNYAFSDGITRFGTPWRANMVPGNSGLGWEKGNFPYAGMCSKPKFNCGDYEPIDPQYTITIGHGPFSLSYQSKDR